MNGRGVVSLFDSITERASKVADDVQASVSRARLEAERRLIGRQHRAALEALGQRTYELVRTGALPAEPLSAELADVDARLDEIEAKLAEIDELKNGEDPPSSPGSGWDAAEDRFSS